MGEMQARVILFAGFPEIKEIVGQINNKSTSVFISFLFPFSFARFFLPSPQYLRPIKSPSTDLSTEGVVLKNFATSAALLG
jgi:hypothetical protein